MRNWFNVKKMPSREGAAGANPERKILGGRAIKGGNPWQRLHLVFAGEGDSVDSVEVYDSDGKWICDALGVRDVDLEGLDLVDSEGVSTLPFEIDRATRHRRWFLREEDLLFTKGGEEHVSLEELHEHAYENESFLLSSGRHGFRADFSDGIGPPRHYILPQGPWSTSQEINLDFRGASFRGADLGSAVLARCDLRGADFTNANLQNASLRGLCLEGCNFDGADLARADLRGTSGLVLNNTAIAGAKFGLEAWNLLNRCRNLWFEFRRRSGRLAPMESMQFPPGTGRVATEDPWSLLVRRYTGPKMLLYGALLVVFLLPLAARAFFWSQINEVQAVIRNVGVLVDKDPVSPCIAPSCVEYSIASILLRFDEGGVAAALAVLFLVYNVLRGVLTLRVSMLHQDVNRDGVSPAQSKYSRLLAIHIVNQFLFIVVFLHVVWVGWEILFRTNVFLPAVVGNP